MKIFLVFLICLGGLIGNGCASARYFKCEPTEFFNEDGNAVQKDCEEL